MCRQDKQFLHAYQVCEHSVPSSTAFYNCSGTLSSPDNLDVWMDTDDFNSAPNLKHTASARKPSFTFTCIKVHPNEPSPAIIEDCPVNSPSNRAKYNREIGSNVLSAASEVGPQCSRNNCILSYSDLDQLLRDIQSSNVSERMMISA